MLTILNISQIVISVLLVTAILMQQGGGGLSNVFGGSSGGYRTKRGAEKFLFMATIALATLFLATAMLNIIIR